MRDKIGRHISGGIKSAVSIANSIDCHSMQIFIGNPAQWRVSTVEEGSAEAFRNGCSSTNIDPVVVHMPYLPNFATANGTIYRKSIDALRSNVERCNEIGAKYLVMHLGSSMGAPKKEGMRRVAEAVCEVLDTSEGRLLLENQAGQKNSVGAEMDDLMKIREDIGGDKVGYCIDTCHAFAAGYDIREEETLDKMSKVIDFDEVYVIHANDSQQDIGSHRDRHENIGKGYIGIEGFRKFLNYGKIGEKPIIMETRTDRKNPEKWEIELVRSLIARR